MTRLFQPTHLFCPICNQDPSHRSGYAASAYESLTNGCYKGHSCGHEFSLFEALQLASTDTFGILSTFAHWHWYSEKEIVVGSIIKISVPLPPDIQPFAAFLTPFTPVDGLQIHYIPRVLSLDGPELLISTSGTIDTLSDQLGVGMRMNVAVYGFHKPESRGWVRLLYESLKDYSEKNWSIAIFKLATSLEIACEQAVEAYLKGKSVAPNLIERLSRNGRNWDSRLGRLSDIAPDFLGSLETQAFRKAAKESVKDIRDCRNSFAHDDPVSADYHSATQAFKTAFPLFWAIEMIRSGSKPVEA